MNVISVQCIIEESGIYLSHMLSLWIPVDTCRWSGWFCPYMCLHSDRGM